MSPPRRTGYLDESFDVDPKTGRSTLVLGVVRVDDRAGAVRDALQDLLLPGADFLHFRKEDDVRRLLLAKTVGQLDLRPVVAVRHSRDSISRARAVGLTTLVWAVHHTLDRLVLEARGAKPDRDDARLLSKLRPEGRSVPAEFLGKRHDPLLWAADVVASATFQAVARGVPESMAALGDVEWHEC